MWEEWVYKTIISFISFQILSFVFKDYIKLAITHYQKNDSKKPGKIKGTLNCLLTCMIPIVRWIIVIFVIILIITGIREDNEG